MTEDELKSLISDRHHPTARLVWLFRTECARIEQANSQRKPPGSLKLWQMELEAIQKIAEAMGVELGGPIKADTYTMRAACMSVGTKQCAPICLSNLPAYDSGKCPFRKEVWTVEKIKAELTRRPDGPLYHHLKPRTKI